MLGGSNGTARITGQPVLPYSGVNPFGSRATAAGVGAIGAAGPGMGQEKDSDGAGFAADILARVCCSTCSRDATSAGRPDPDGRAVVAETETVGL